MNENVCFFFEGMTLSLGEATLSDSGWDIPEWAISFLAEVVEEGFKVVGVSFYPGNSCATTRGEEDSLGAGG